MPSTSATAVQDLKVSGVPPLIGFVSRAVLVRAVVFAAVLGSVLTAVNQADALFGEADLRVLPLILVFASPLTVVIFSQAFAIRRAHLDAHLASPSERNAGFLQTASRHGIPQRSLALGLAVGSINSAIVTGAALLEGTPFAHLPFALLGQAFVLPVLFGVLAQTASYRRARKALAPADLFPG